MFVSCRGQFFCSLSKHFDLESAPRPKAHMQNPQRRHLANVPCPTKCRSETRSSHISTLTLRMLLRSQQLVPPFSRNLVCSRWFPVPKPTATPSASSGLNGSSNGDTRGQAIAACSRTPSGIVDENSGDPECSNEVSAGLFRSGSTFRQRHQAPDGRAVLFLSDVTMCK